MLLDAGSDLADVLDEVRRIDVQTRRLVTGVMAGGYLSVFRGSGIEFETVREYAEGDPERSVDWNVTARMGRPFVKTYVDERELTVLFLLDLSASMTGGFGVWSARQTAARLCACLALSAVRNGDKVGLVAFSEAVDAYVKPRKGLGHALRIVRDCLVLPGRSDRTALAPALEFASRAVRRHAIVFLVSDFLSDGWERALGLCARRHDLIAVRLLSPEVGRHTWRPYGSVDADPPVGAARVPPAAGMVRVRDPETGEARLLDLGSKRVREAWAARTDAWRQRVERRLRRAGVDRMDVRIPRERRAEAVVRPILRFFRMRELRGTKR